MATLCVDHADMEEVALDAAILNGDNFKELERAGVFLSSMDLRFAALRGADLSRLDLTGVNLSGVDLSEANLMRTVLENANLSDATMPGANLRRAQLAGADLSGAQLAGADLSWAQLAGADLRRAQLPGAHLREAQLAGVDLRDAQLAGASFWRNHWWRAEVDEESSLTFPEIAFVEPEHCPEWTAEDYMALRDKIVSEVPEGGGGIGLWSASRDSIPRWP